MKNVQTIALAFALVASSANAFKCPTVSKPACFSKLSMPAMPELNSKNALIATAAVAAVGGLCVAYNKGLIGKAATAIQDIVTTHPRKTAAVLVTATALIAANYFGCFDSTMSSLSSWFTKTDAKALVVTENAPVVVDTKNINNVAGNAASTGDATVPLVGTGAKLEASVVDVQSAPSLEKKTQN